MGILERTKHLIRSDLNELLKKAKDPEVVLDAYLDDLEVVMAEVCGIRRGEEADRESLAARMRDTLDAQKTWEKKARTCLKRNDVELARSALERKIDLQDSIGELERELAQREETLAILDQSVETIRTRISEVQKRRREMRFRRQLLQARSELQSKLEQMNEEDEPVLSAAHDSLLELEGRLSAEESFRQESTDERLLQLEIADRRRQRQQAVDRELDALRLQLKRK